MRPSILLELLCVLTRLCRRASCFVNTVHGGGRKLAWLALVILGWATTTSNVIGQTLVTNGCFVVTCPPNDTNFTCGSSMTFSSHGISVTNQCPDGVAPPFDVQCQPPLGTSLALGVHSVTCSIVAEGAVIANCEFLITVELDTERPFVPCPTGRLLVARCASNCVPMMYDLPTVSHGTLIGCNPPPGTCFPVGLTPVTCLASNDCGDRRGCGFMIRVDREAQEVLVILCPNNDIIASVSCLSSNYCVTVTYPLPEVRGGTLIECTPPPGTCFYGNSTGGTTALHLVTCRATNDCGLRTECSFSIRVVGDPQRPRFQEPFFGGEFTSQCGSNCVPLFYRVPPVANGTLESCNPPPGTCLPVGTHWVSCRAINACYDQVTSFEVRVVQGPARPPTIRIVRREDLYSLYWENECGSIGVLETSDDPDGPWETIHGASPGYLVNPSKFKQFFRVTLP